MDQKIHAIPTIGPRGIQFRSRLEARWAYFFDMLKWDWEYEPIDLKGYIPDFIISFPKQSSKLLVEVKGELDYDQLEKYSSKIIESGWNDSFLIVGAKVWSIKYPLTLKNWSREECELTHTCAVINIGKIFVESDSGGSFDAYLIIDNDKWYINYVDYGFGWLYCIGDGDDKEACKPPGWVYNEESIDVYNFFVKAKNYSQYKSNNNVPNIKSVSEEKFVVVDKDILQNFIDSKMIKSNGEHTPIKTFRFRFLF